VVTICTTSLNIKKFYILPTEYLYLLYMSQKKTSKFSLYNHQRPAFITEEASVYCAVRTGSLNKMDYVLSLNGQLLIYLYVMYKYRRYKVINKRIIFSMKIIISCPITTLILVIFCA